MGKSSRSARFARDFSHKKCVREADGGKKSHDIKNTAGKTTWVRSQNKQRTLDHMIDPKLFLTVYRDVS